MVGVVHMHDFLYRGGVNSIKQRSFIDVRSLRIFSDVEPAMQRMQSDFQRMQFPPARY
jgi:hypothetical protein